MRNCKKCNKVIPFRMKIDGKIRNTQRRKFCLECSPFGLHNTKQDLSKSGLVESICVDCQRSYIFIRNKGGTLERCNSCWTKKRRDALKDEYKTAAGGCCRRCGYTICDQALHFHHIDPKTKSFEISSSYNKKRELVLEELKKCVLICGNCHSELHCGLWKIEDLQCHV